MAGELYPTALLVGTGDVRSWLGIKEGDKGPNQKIQDLILAVEDFTESYCNRQLKARLFKTHPDLCYFDGTGRPWLYLPVTPVWYVNEVRVDADREFGAATQIDTDDIITYHQEGKIVSEAGYFTRGRRNVRVEYHAGYGAGSYPVPYDLKQVIIEMSAQALNEGITAVHTVKGPEEAKFVNMLATHSMWRKTLNYYKRRSIIAGYGYDIP